MKFTNMKRGQEEIVGFVIIVVIVALIGVFLLSFSLKNNTSTATQSSEVRQFLGSMMEYTGNCSTDQEGTNNELRMNLIACGGNSQITCLSGENVCDSARNTAKQLLSASFKVSNETAIRGYEFSADFDGLSKNIVNVTAGDCSGSYKADNVLYSGDVKIRVSLKECS